MVVYTFMHVTLFITSNLELELFNIMLECAGHLFFSTRTPSPKAESAESRLFLFRVKFLININIQENSKINCHFIIAIHIR